MERENSIDIAKGFAIILMMVGHCYSVQNTLWILIYGFHMPFFFIVSGIIYGKKMKINREFNAMKKLRKLLVPYFLSEILLAVFISALNHPDGFIKTLFGQMITIGSLQGMHATWFLPCMAAATIPFLLFWRYKPQVAFAFAAGCMLIGLAAAIPDGYGVVICRTMVAIGFFAIGFISADCALNKANPYIIVFALVAYIVLTCYNGLVSLVSDEFHHRGLYVLNSLLGTWITLQGASMLSNHRYGRLVKKFLIVFGKNTMVVLCTHVFFIEIIRLFDYKVCGSILPKLGIMEGIVFAAILCILEAATIAVWTKYRKSNAIGKKMVQTC